MNLKRVFGTNVRHHRKAVGMTQEGLAAKVEVSIETIGKVERGAAAPSFDTAEKIAAALHVPTVALFGAGTNATPKGERGKLLHSIHAILASMNEDQLRKAANLLNAFLGR